MKLLELEISKIRGIPDISLKPDGKNLVVCGPNGSGKSAVVDAIDFLLTGEISRLTGRGTAGITLQKHGPHIDHQPKDATVCAKIRLPGLADAIQIKRCIATPSVLECDKKVIQHLEPIMTLAKGGQHVLTRRDILRFITAEASSRAKEIQELLHISEIDNIRKALVRVEHDLSNETKIAGTGLNTARGAVNATLQERTFSRQAVLDAVNHNRSTLGSQPIHVLRSTDLKKDITPPTLTTLEQVINIDLLERDIKNLNNLTSQQSQSQVGRADTDLRELLGTIRADPTLLRELSPVKLTQLGINMIDSSGSCPLCDKPWPPGKLREYLEQRLRTANLASKHDEAVETQSNVIAAFISPTVASLREVIRVAQALNRKADIVSLEGWLADLQELSTLLSASLDKYPDPRFDSTRVQRLLAPTDLAQMLKDILQAATLKYPKATCSQIAWDTLTRLEENLRALESAETSFADAKCAQERAAILLGSFLAARDDILGKLYEDIRDRFVRLYRLLHGDDEVNFDASIEPDEAGLSLEVDFYGRGTHPPHALHSEGHQDSMGICLYLALNERLLGDLIELIILDDVMMSVDADHRREVCRLLAESFPHRQFFITTHDKTWSRQLRTEGIVGPRGTIEFHNWHIQSGPQVNYEADMWDRIEKDLLENEVPSAAAKLRRGSEEFFGIACESLHAEIVCKLDGRWELGDFLPAAMGKYRKLLKKAKNSAQSWGQDDRFEMLQELDSTVSQIYKRTSAEQWAVNVNVHYNNWANFTEKDFRPVAEAFQDLHSLFLCSKCGGMLHLALMGMEPVAVRCSCGKVDWNLRERREIGSGL